MRLSVSSRKASPLKQGRAKEKTVFLRKNRKKLRIVNIQNPIVRLNYLQIGFFCIRVANIPRKDEYMNGQPLTMGSLFDGSGGFPLAATLNNVQPLWSSEIEPYPIKVTSKRFPQMKHYGNINEISGKEIEPVDIITFGSPCQDMSMAGKRRGMLNTCSNCKAEYKITAEEEQCPQCGADLEKTRSGLFVEAIRIIKEMREATNGKYPTFIIWENVTGAYSSNKGEDFRTVLEEICSITDHSLSIPQPKGNKWLKAGEVLGDNHSIAWRTFDAQYWGVPQRRRRIFLVADFGGQRASEILFESARLQRDIAPGEEPRERAAADPEGSFGETGTDTELIYGIGRTAWRSGVNFHCSPTITENITPTLTTEEPHAVAYKQQLYENHSNDSRYKGPLEKSPTLSARLGTGGNNQPFVVNCIQGSMIGRADEHGPQGSGINEDVCFTLNTVDRHAISALIDRSPIPYGISSYDSNAMKSENPYSGIYEADTSRTLDQSGGNPSCNQGGIAVVCSVLQNIEHFGEGSYGTFYEGQVSTLKACGGTLGGGSETLCLTTGSHMSVSEGKSHTLMARDYKDPQCVTKSNEKSNDNCNYIVRRLTPLECSRLQGFPDWWTAGTETENPTEEEMAFWREVFETHREVVTGAKKPKTDNQIRKWLKEPGTDGAIYKMWGNGIALPCAFAVFKGITQVFKKNG